LVANGTYYALYYYFDATKFLDEQWYQKIKIAGKVAINDTQTYISRQVQYFGVSIRQTIAVNETLQLHRMDQQAFRYQKYIVNGA